VLCALALVVSIISPLPLTEAASSAISLVIAVVAPFHQEKATAPAQEEEVKKTAPREGTPQRTQISRIRIIALETRDVPFTIALNSIIVVSPEIATAQIKNPGTLILTGLKVGETILIASDGRRRYTFLIEVVGRSLTTTGRATSLAEPSAVEQGSLSGSIAVSFSAPIGDRPALLRQSFQMRRTLSPGRTLRFSGEMFKFMGRGDRDLLRATTPGFGLDRLSLGMDTPEGTLDILDSQVNISPLSLNNFTMRGFHLVSTPDSRLRGMELFAGLARPSLSLLNDSQGWLAGILLPVAQGKSWRVRAGLLAVSPQRSNDLGKGGAIWQIDGRYAPNGNLTAEGEAAYANGGLSWRARLDLQRGPFNAYGEIIRLDRRSPLISIGAQAGELKTEAFAVQWRPSTRFNASVSYNHTAIAPPATALLRAALDRTSFVASTGYQLTRNSRLGFRFTEQRIETGMPGGDSRFQLETRTATVSHNIRFNRSWANSFEGRLNYSREASADAETERGFYFKEQLRFSWRGGSATGFVNYTRKTPSLTGLIIRHPQLLPPLLQRAFLLDPARFLQTNRDALAELLPGVELPQTRSLEAGLRLQAAFSRVNLGGEVRYIAGEILARDQRNLLASFSASLKLDAANSVQVSGSRSFPAGGAGGQSALTVSYIHRFGAGSGGGFQFSNALGLNRGLIQGRVFFDTNGNGREDAGESGVPGMRIQIDGNKSATTDAGGNFRFQINPGQYSVALISADLGVRLRASTLTEQKVSLSSRQTVNLSFGVSNFGTISGRVFNDLFLTGGSPTTNMPGISGVRLILHSEAVAGGPVVTGVVDVGGSYEFRNLRPGTYMLEIDPSTLPANYRLPLQVVWPIRVEPLSSVYLDIPLAAQRAISGIVFIDSDGDGSFDPQKDEVVVGARVTAVGTEALSGTGGSYVLRNLPAGKTEIVAHASWGVKSRPIFLELGAEPATRRNLNLRVMR
jgi:hypothetical protein